MKRVNNLLDGIINLRAMSHDNEQNPYTLRYIKIFFSGNIICHNRSFYSTYSAKYSAANFRSHAAFFSSGIFFSISIRISVVILSSAVKIFI